MLPYIVLALIALLIGYGIYRMVLARMLFKYDDCNPYRRVCKRCGQQQDMFESNFVDSFDFWWENMGVKGDRQCKCQSYASYRP